MELTIKKFSLPGDDDENFFKDVSWSKSNRNER